MAAEVKQMFSWKSSGENETILLILNSQKINYNLKMWEKWLNSVRFQFPLLLLGCALRDLALSLSLQGILIHVCFHICFTSSALWILKFQHVFSRGLVLPKDKACLCKNARLSIQIKAKWYTRSHHPPDTYWVVSVVGSEKSWQLQISNMYCSAPTGFTYWAITTNMCSYRKQKLQSKCKPGTKTICWSVICFLHCALYNCWIFFTFICNLLSAEGKRHRRFS